MKIKKIIISIITVLSVSFLFQMSVHSLSGSVWLIDYDGEDEVLNKNTEEYKNKAETVIYDYENNVLTLNNYNGGPIYYDEEEPLKVVLKGENVITAKEEDGFISINDITFSGEGSLLIKNAITAIKVSNGDLKLDNINLTIDTVDDNGIEVFEGDVTIDGGNVTFIDVDEIDISAGYLNETQKGNITVNGNIKTENKVKDTYTSEGLSAENKLTINGGEMVFYVSTYGLYAPNIIINDGKISINPEVDYNPMAGISADETLTINGGNIYSTGDFYALYAMDDITINGAKIKGKSYFGAIVGEGAININSGYIDLETPNGGHSVALVLLNGDEKLLNLSNKMVITPEGFSKQKVLVSQEIEPSDIYAITFGTKDITATLGDWILDLTVTNAADSIILYSEHKIKFNTNGGNEIADAIVSYGNKVTKPTDPEKEGYIFNGWYVDSTLENEYDFDTEVTKDLTLYAKWSEGETNPETGDYFGLYLSICLISISGVGICLYSLKKKKFN